MSIDLNAFKKILAEHKVFDAFQYVESLAEIMLYMKLSEELVYNAYAQRKKSLREQEQKLNNEALNSGVAYITEDILNCTNLEIAGMEIDDTLFIRKNIFEFFHYARISFDVIFQIINTALLGDCAYDSADRRLIRKVSDTVTNTPNFTQLNNLLITNRNADYYKYLQAFDNYIKHNKTILVTLKDSFIFGNESEFIVKEFVNDGVHYSEVDALNKIKLISSYVTKTIEDILYEIYNQVPNCLDTNKRIQEINFFEQNKNNLDSYVTEYISFFINVQNDISEIPNEIKILPLKFNKNGDIFSFDLKVKKIFIRKQNDKDKYAIIGCAELKNGLNTNEVYREYSVKTCDARAYSEYLVSYADEYSQLSVNYQAMEGQRVWY